MPYKKRFHKFWVLLGLFTVFLVAIIIRFPLEKYQVGNIDCYVYPPMSVLIKNTATIPWLLHPFFSFIGIYPGSDTSGFMIFQSANYILLNSSTILSANLFFDLFILIIMTLAFFLLARMFLRNPIYQLFATFSFIGSYYIVRDTLLYLPGPRCVAAMYALLCILVLVFMVKKRRITNIKWLTLGAIFLFGGISNHLLALYFLPFVVLIALMVMFIMRFFPYIVKIFPKPVLITKYYWIFWFTILCVFFVLPFTGITPVGYKQFYASAQMYKTESRFIPSFITSNIFVVLALTYLSKYGPMILLSAIGGVYLVIKRKKTPIEILLIFLLCFSLLMMFETGYYILIFSVFLSILAGFSLEFILSDHRKKAIRIFAYAMGISAICIPLISYMLIVGKYQEILYDLTFVFPIIGSFLILFFVVKSRIYNKTQATIRCALVVFIVITPATMIHAYNTDLITYNKLSVNNVPLDRPDHLLESISLYQKYFASKDRFFSSSGNIMVTAQTLSELGSTRIYYILYDKNLRDNYTITPVAWSYDRPKTFFTAKVMINNLSFTDPDDFGSVILLYLDPHTGREIGRTLNAHYVHEYIPLSGNIYMIGGKLITQPVIPSPFLRYASQSFYTVYENDNYRSYYF